MTTWNVNDDWGVGDPASIVDENNTGGIVGPNLISSNIASSSPVDADSLNAQISRERYQYYKDNFLPVERAAAGQIRTPAEIEARTENAGIRAGTAYKTAEADFGRNMGRQGNTLSPDQKAEADKLFKRERTAGIGGAKTRTRSDLYDTNMQNRGEFVGLGRNILTGAQSSLGSAANSQARTDAANEQIGAQEDAAMLSTIGTLASVAIMSGI